MRTRKIIGASIEEKEERFCMHICMYNTTFVMIAGEKPPQDVWHDTLVLF